MQAGNKKIHVLHIPRWFPHRDDAMLGLFVKNHLHSLSGKTQNSVLFLHFVDKQASTYEMEISDSEFYSCTTYIRKSNFKLSLVKNVVNASRYFRAFRKSYKIIFQRFGKPDLAHVHVLTRPAIAALCLKSFSGIPYMVSEHWSRYFSKHNNYKGFFRKFMTRMAVKRAEALVCVSEPLHQALKAHKLDHKQCHLVPNVVDVNLFKPAIDNEPSEILNLIHISCFEDQSKNISGLLHAMKLLRSKNIPVKLELIGDGPDKEALEQLAESLGLAAPDVVFYGMLMPGELIEKLQHADYLVQTSHYETFSTVVAESLACGVPVISTPVGIYPELYDHGIGLMIPASSPEEIASTIKIAFTRKGSFDKSLLRKLAIERFSNENVGMALYSIYQDILSEPKR